MTYQGGSWVSQKSYINIIDRGMMLSKDFREFVGLLNKNEVSWIFYSGYILSIPFS
jgi:hypothetical protein